MTHLVHRAYTVSIQQRNLIRPSVALAQGSFYLLTGLWPVLGVRSFQRLTGPKTDVWLVKTVGLLTTAVGAVLVLGANDTDDSRLAALGAAAAAALAGIDLTYVSKRVISRVYLGDAAAQLAFVFGWIAAGRGTTP